MDAFEKTYIIHFGNDGNRKLDAALIGWHIAKDELRCKESTFRRQANINGWRCFDQGRNFYLKLKGGKK